MTSEQRLSRLSEYDRRSEEWPNRYHIVRQGLKWHVKCGAGTRSLGSFWRRHRAMVSAAELLTAFHDGAFVAKRYGGGRYA